MPFRRLKQKLSRTSTDESNSSLAVDSEPKVLYYKPGEKMPIKYRRPVDKAHKEKLEAFSFETAWRRRSFESEVSPMASRAPSRKNSMDLRRSLQRRDTVESDDSSTPGAGLSSCDTVSTLDGSDMLSTSSSNFTRRNDTPFTQEDLTLALQRSRLDMSS